MPVTAFLRRGPALATALLLLVSLTMALPGDLSAQETPPPYHLGVGDVMELRVWQMPELDRTMTVDESGRLTVPLIGDVRATGRLVPDVEEEIVERIQVFHRNISRVSLELTEYNSKAFFVIGAVVTPGVYRVEAGSQIGRASCRERV